MAVSDARRAQAIVTRYAVYVRRVANGVERLIRRPYDVVQYNWGNGEMPTYLQPIARGPSPTLDEEIYDGIRIYDRAPLWDITTSK